MCLMYTQCLVEPVGQVSLGPLNLEYPGREAPLEPPGGGAAPWLGLLGAARVLHVGAPSFSPSRGAGIPARQQAYLAGGWMQIAFAVINEVITKMHLTWDRSGRVEMESRVGQSPGGTLAKTGPWLWSVPGRLETPIPLPTTKTLASPSITCLLVAFASPNQGLPCWAWTAKLQGPMPGSRRPLCPLLTGAEQWAWVR